MNRRLIGFTMIALVLAWSSTAFGQTWGGRGASAFGGGGFGTNSFGTGGFGNAGFGGSRFGSSGIGGMGGFGQSAFGNSGFGGNRGFGGGGFGNTGFGTGGFGNTGFGTGGGMYGGGQSFVGRDSADMQATFSQLNRTATQITNQMNRDMSRRTRRERQSQSSGENAPPQVRVELRLGFTAPQAAPGAVAERVRTRLGKILTQHNMAQPDVTMEGDVAVLRGVAESDSQRLVLERLVALEPGVRAVRNEMVVAAATADALPAP
jgi:osmotically-inducible protein OsmY